MIWWGRWMRGRQNREAQREDNLVLLDEIRKAQMEWQVSAKRLDCVVEKDQVDYAIYAMEAAEKRYEMLLRLAKQINLNAEPYGKAAGSGRLIQ